MTKDKKSSKKEVGYALPAKNRRTEDNWELRFPNSCNVYSKMLRQDAQISSVYKAVTLPIRRAGWWIDPNGADDEVVNHIAHDLRLPIKGQKAEFVGTLEGASWDEHLQMLLLSLVYGFAFFEQVYEVGEDGREHLKKLAPRLPQSISKIVVDDDGGLAGIEQRPLPGDTEPIFIPVNRLVAYIHDPVDTSWQGTSILRPAYKHWMIRDELIRMEVNALDRNSMGVPIYKGSDIAEDPNADLDYGQELAESIRGGESAGGSIPAGSDIKLLGINGQILSPRDAIKYHDEMIAKAVLAHFLNLGEGGGSYALASTQSDLFIQSLQTKGEWVAQTATQYVVEDLVRMAFPDYKGNIPFISFDAIASTKEITPAEIVQLVHAKVLFVDEQLDSYIRRRYGLPEKLSFKEAMKRKSEAQKIREKYGITEESTAEETQETQGGEN